MAWCKELPKALIERALQTELTEYQGYEKHAADGRGSGNSRTGTSAKTLKAEQGDLPLEIPRDRRGDFEPQLVTIGQRRSSVLDEKLIAAVWPRFDRVGYPGTPGRDV